VKVACELAQAFAQMIRGRNASALEAWQQETTTSGAPELRTFAAGIKRDQAAVLAALTCEWSQGQVEGRSTASSCSNVNPMGVLDLTCYDIGCWLEAHELSTEDNAEPKLGMVSITLGYCIGKSFSNVSISLDKTTSFSS